MSRERRREMVNRQFPMEFHRGIARFIVCRLGRVTDPGFETLQAGCCLDKGAVHREVLVR